MGFSHWKGKWHEGDRKGKILGMILSFLMERDMKEASEALQPGCEAAYHPVASFVFFAFNTGG